MGKAPLAVYLHWPFCQSKCPYCDFNSHVREQVDEGRWKTALLQELDAMAHHVPDRIVTSIFFGGGTPSLMPPATAGALIERIHQLYPVTDDIEITLEANPGTVEAARFADFAKAGINRLSLGVQSLDDTQLKFLGRKHDAAQALKAIDIAQKNFGRMSFDLIYARPGQTMDEWEKELTQALTHAGGHISLYQLTIEENTAFHHAVGKGEFAIPGEEEAEALYLLTENITRAHGFSSYEVSNYAKPGEESRHNLAYWQGDDYIGVGPGAHGRITLKRTRSGSTDPHRAHGSGRAPSTDGSDDSVRIATSTIKSPERWLEEVARSGMAAEVWEETSHVREMQERLMMGLRLATGISYAGFKKQTGQDLDAFIDTEKRALFIKEGLLENNPERLQTTMKGRLVLNSLTAELLPEEQAQELLPPQH